MHLFEGHVGGGFGIRGELYPEDVLVCLAALRLGRPVKWIEDRREHLIAANHSRQQRHKVRAAVDADGPHSRASTTSSSTTRAAMCAPMRPPCPTSPPAMLPGPYRVPAYRALGHVRLTNKTPGGTYRAPGRFESTFVRERLMDAIAARLGDRPRSRCAGATSIAKEEMPYRAAAGDARRPTSCSIPATMPACSTRHWPRSTGTSCRTASGAAAPAANASGPASAIFVEKSGLGPFDGVRLSVDPRALVEVVTGAASLGQGVETVMAQICADALGVDYRRVRVVHGRTDRIAFGMGAFASRVTVMTGRGDPPCRGRGARQGDRRRGRAAAAAGRCARARSTARWCARDAPAGPSMTLGEIAKALEPASKLRGARAPGLAADGWFYSDHMNYPYGVHIAVARVDRDTGGVTIERYLLAYDIGRAVNPMLVEGQLAGGFAQGIGGALLEEFLYDERGEPLSVNFADYLMPTAREVPALEVLITEDAPSPLNPLGLKGAGEGGINAVGAAIASAIDDAIGIPGAITRLPVTPQRLREILKRSGRA